jgi:colanic acid biosynthesis glycosyl transferase WcaI
VHDYAGHPFPIQLSRELALRAHEVRHLYAGYNQTPRGALGFRDNDPPNLAIEGVFIRNPLQKDHFIRRWVQEREYGQCLMQEVAEHRPEVVISANTPLDSQAALISGSRKWNAKFIFWLQDFIGIATRSILHRRLPLVGGLIGSHFIRIERNLLRKSDAIVTITEAFVPTLRSWGIPECKTEVIPNWSPIDELPVLTKKNPWASELAIDEGFTFLYTGTLRMKHNPTLLLELVKSLHSSGSFARFVVISEGPGAEWLRERAASFGLNNLTVLDFQPMERYAEVLASADVLVAILEKEAGAFSVPSKVLSYLCAKRPLLLAVPKENRAARIVERSEAGIVVEPDDLDGFIQGAWTLMTSPVLRADMGENARRYAEGSFDIHSITDRFEGLIAKL